jgi:hypothetical protein
MRSTQKPFSALWKVTRSIDPASTSVGCGLAWAGSVGDGRARAEVAFGLTFAGFSLADVEWCTSGRSRCSPPGQGQSARLDRQRVAADDPVGGKRPGLLDRIEVLIKLKVGLAVLLHEALTP